jgi:transaldolase
MLNDLNIKLFADGADLRDIVALASKPWIRGFTTNPTLMRKAGVVDYRHFARELVGVVGGRPVSLEVFADDVIDMERQADEIASWASNIYVKIPITNSRREPTSNLISRLSRRGVQVNVTAVFTLAQVSEAVANMAPETPGIISVFAGRIADTGRDPAPLMRRAKTILADRQRVELLWASPREILNVVQAAQTGCDIITASADILSKLPLLGKDLTEFSLETVKMFHRDATAAGYSIAEFAMEA